MWKLWRIAVGACILAGACAACVCGRPGADEQARFARPVYATFGEGTLDTGLGRGDRSLDRIGHAGFPGYDVFLVQGKDLTDAISATVSVLCEGASADTPAPGKGGPSKSIWAAVNLRGAAGSSSPAWDMRRVEVQGNRVRVIVKYLIRDGGTDDMHYYVAWVALGELKPGMYHLTLCDEAKGGVHVERRVLVPGGK